MYTAVSSAQLLAGILKITDGKVSTCYLYLRERLGSGHEIYLLAITQH